MDATTETAIVERTISIDASPETVFEFFGDPEKLMRWKGAPRPPERGRGRVTRGRLGPLPAAARGRGGRR
jgi:uncharacterized protein YndB with AHSA1/START domain